KSAMGARTLRRWIMRPLKSRDAIFERHDAVDELTRSRAIAEGMGQQLARIADLERLASRITLRSASPRECLTLADSLHAVEELREVMKPLQGPLMMRLREQLCHPESSEGPARVEGTSSAPPATPRSLASARDDIVNALIDLVERTIDSDSPPSIRDGGAIRSGIDRELDELRAIARDSKSILMQIEARERERTGITSLKIRYNSVFGYYIEVSKSNFAKVPADYIRKQTLVNAERFITPDLKELEEKIVGAEEKAIAIEARLYDDLLAGVAKESAAILAVGGAVGEIDALASLATIAVRHRYVRAALSDAAEISIEDGRHPVIEVIGAERFIPNHTDVEHARNGIQIITGPNMGG